MRIDTMVTIADVERSQFTPDFGFMWFLADRTYVTIVLMLRLLSSVCRRLFVVGARADRGRRRLSNGKPILIFFREQLPLHWNR